MDGIGPTTQAQAAGLCGVGTRFLSEMERGKPTAEIGRVLRVLAGLGLQVHVGQPDATLAGEQGWGGMAEGLPALAVALAEEQAQAFGLSAIVTRIVDTS